MVGDRVAMFTPNHVLYSTVLMGVLAAGGTVTPANPQYTASEFARQLSETQSKIVVTNNSLLPLVREALNLASIDRYHLIVLESSWEPSVYSIDQMLVEATFQRPLVNPESTAYICYSSGTSGQPKGVVTTHLNIVSSICQQSLIYESRGQVISGSLPYYHMYGLCRCLHTPLVVPGAQTVVMSRFDIVEFLEAIEKYRITKLMIVPPIALMLLKHPLADKFNMSSVRKINSAAAPLGKELSLELTHKFGITVVEGYGLTETSPVALCFAYDDHLHGAVGQLAPNMEAKIVCPETGKELSYDQEGEIWFRGPNIMQGYFLNSTATAE
ncbi:hypothetical protein K7432_001785, partial [Basidiobolus ranarum]